MIRRSKRLTAIACALLCVAGWAIAGAVTTASASSPCPWMEASLSPNQRAHELVSAMTIDQKIAMLSQAQPIWAHFGAAGFIPGQPSLCIPDLVINDAGQGVGDRETNTTAFPAPIAQSRAGTRRCSGSSARLSAGRRGTRASTSSWPRASRSTGCR